MNRRSTATSSRPWPRQVGSDRGSGPPAVPKGCGHGRAVASAGVRVCHHCAAGWVIYWLLLAEVDDDGRQLWVFLVIRVLASYTLLPRLIRVLTRIYVPD